MENEKRLIDANALKERAIRVSTVKEHCYIKAVGTHEIDKAPTVDAVEVVHAEWTVIEDEYFCFTTLECSACGEQYCFEEYDEEMPPHYHYCPNCGAKMDGDGNG